MKPLLPLINATVVCLLLSFSVQSVAWGPLGHKAVCDAAWRASGNASQQALAAAAKRMGFKTYADACLWPDRIRNQHQFNWTKPLHYLNVSRGDQVVGEGACVAIEYHSRSTAMRKPRCVWQAVQYFHARWQDEQLSQSQRDEALLFMSHFVVDLHQPLHVAYQDDRGGTRTKVIFEGKLMSLHSLWDSDILYCGTGASWRTLGKQLYRQANFREKQGNIEQWADESLALTRSIYGNLTQNLADDYCQRFHPVAMARLALASSRLAALFNPATAFSLLGQSHSGDLDRGIEASGARGIDKVQSAPSVIERIKAFWTSLWKSILT